MGLLRVGLLLATAVHASGVLAVDGKGCPSIADHQRFVDEIVNGNVDYTYPPSCIDLPSQTRVSDPIESKLDRFGSEMTEFILVDVAGRGRYWTLASWVKLTPSEAEPAPAGIKPEPSEPQSSEPQSSKIESAPAKTEPEPSEFDSAALEIEPPPGEATGALGPSPLNLKASQVWFAEELRKRFEDYIPIRGSEFAFDQVATLPKDITRFDFSAKETVITFSVAGSLRLSALPPPFKVTGGAEDGGYKLYLQAYLFSPTGRLVWMQQGEPRENAPVSANGGSVTFNLIDTYMGSLAGHDLLVVAAGDRILPEASRIPVILGAKKIRFP